MSISRSLEGIQQSGIIVVFRSLEPNIAVQTAHALYEVGIRVVEVTVDSPGAFETIATMSNQLPKDVLVGAGTVLDAPSATAAIRAGAQFLLAPNLNVDVIKTANRYGRVAIPGVMTPTEMVNAAEAGAPAVKLFPANVLGTEFIKQVRAPLPHIPIIPTGGISEENVARFIEVGAFAVGVGASLIRDDPQNGRLDAVKDRARALVDAVAKARADAQ